MPNKNNSDSPWEKVQKVNKLLEQGEPDNITTDSYSNMSGYQPQAIFDAMNEVFGIGGWGHEEIEAKYDNPEKPTMVIFRLRVWLRHETKKIDKTAYGQARITRGDMGDAYKGAQTDAIKKGLSFFSVGRRAYLGLLNTSGKRSQIKRQVLTQPSTPPPQQQEAPAKKCQLCGAMEPWHKPGCPNKKT